MKFIDTFTEEEKKKLTKKAKLIFSVLKNGSITRKDGVKFSYELGDNMVVTILDGVPYVYAFINKIIERTYCPINDKEMSYLIRKKFDNFGIDIDLQIPKHFEFVKYEGKKPWEEPLNEEIDRRPFLKKQKKKGELVYKLYKKGKLVSDREAGEIHYTYELSDNKLINAYGDTISISPDNIKIKYHNELTNKFALLPILDSIKKRFHNHGATLNIPQWTEIYIDKWKEPKEEPINESEDKEMKRVRTIHRSLRKGVISLKNGDRFRYELPEEYTFHVVDESISVRFTFYNQDVTGDKGGINLPLKVWRIQDGKDEYINEILSAYDVADICYGDEYKMDTKSGVEYINVKNKVRNKYRNFDINCIMTTPSDTVVMYESENVNQEKLKQKGNAVYKAIRKGKMKIYINGEHREPAIFSYEMSEEKSIITTVLGDIFITPESFKIKHLNKECLSLIRNDVEKAFKKEFMDKFDIRLRDDNLFYDEQTEFYDYNEKGLNEGEDKMIKKGRTVFKALKKGTIGGDDPEQPHFRYELSDKFSVFTNNVGIVIEVEKIKIKHLNRGCLLHSSDYMSSLIRKRFSHFGIVLTSTYDDRYFEYDVEPWERPINEGAEVLNPESLTDKEIKKVKLLYKSFKEMVFTYDQLSNYGITLPENYYIYKDELGEVCIKLDKEDTDKLYMFARIKFTSGSHYDRQLEPHHDGLHRWVKQRVIDKFEGFNIKFIF